MRIVGYHVAQDGTVYTSTSTFPPPFGLPALFHDDLDNDDQVICVFYHLNWSVANILKNIGCTDEQLTLINKAHQLHLAPYQFNYIPNKYFSVKYGGGLNAPFNAFSDMSQYAHTDFTLDGAQMAKDAQATGEKVYSALTRLGLKPVSLTSPIRAYERDVLQKISLPTIDDIPVEAAEYAYNCTHGGWLEAYQKGHWDKAYDYDMTCYSEDTEILTLANGWQPIKSISKDAFVLAFVPETNTCEYEKVDAVHEYSYTGKMIHLCSTRKDRKPNPRSNYDLLVTPNHRVLYKDHIRSKKSLNYGQYSDWKLSFAKDLPLSVRLPMCYPTSLTANISIDDALIKLIAWITTEGWQSEGRLFICQSEKHIENCNEIRSILKILNIKHSESIRPVRKVRATGFLSKFACYVWALSKVDSTAIFHNFNKDNIHLPARWLIHELSSRQLRLYIDTYIKGDGTHHPGKCTIYTKYKEAADTLSEIAQLIGIRNTVTSRLDSRGNPRYMVNIVTREETTRRKHGTQSVFDLTTYYTEDRYESYSGMVYCPTVKSGFVVVRRNGKPAISGNSAYPYFVSNLLDLRNGKWVQSADYQKDALYGYVHCGINIYRNFSPILYGMDESLYTPTGEWEGYLTKAEVEFIDTWGLGSVKIMDGWWWMPDWDKMEFPLKDQMHWLWSMKNTATGMDLEVVKRIMSGTWGKFLEIRDQGFGPFFNPVWGAEVESRVRLKVAELCLRNQVVPLHIAVDGMITDRPLEIKQENAMGQWRLSHTGACIIVSSGVVAMENKHGVSDFSLEYDWMKRQIEDKPGESVYSMSKLSPLTLPKAVNQNRLGELGNLETITKTVDVEYEMKRCYQEVPRTGEELMSKKYQSEPWDIGMINLQEVQSLES